MRWFDPKKWTCWHLVMAFYERELDIALPRYGVDRYEDGVDVASEFRGAIGSGDWTEVGSGVQRFGDVVAFSEMKGFEGHVAVIVAPGTIMHVFEGSYTVVDPRYDKRGLPPPSGIYRWSAE